VEIPASRANLKTPRKWLFLLYIIIHGILSVMKRLSLPKRNKNILSKEVLFDLYVNKKYSTSKISGIFNCSENKINYWLGKFKINKRTISEAIYQFKNPLGDPFNLNLPKTIEQGIIFGMGLGLYWGEGSKRGNGGVKLTNTDPRLIKKFIDFLEIIFNIDRKKLRFSLQIFKDISEQRVLNYWTRVLLVKKNQFYKVVHSKIRGEGTYKIKSEYGVVIVHFNNVKLKRIILDMIEKVD
jgi:hypothetical protein